MENNRKLTVQWDKIHSSRLSIIGLVSHIDLCLLSLFQSFFLQVSGPSRAAFIFVVGMLSAELVQVTIPTMPEQTVYISSDPEFCQEFRISCNNKCMFIIKLKILFNMT